MSFYERLSELPIAAQLRVAIKTSDIGLLHRLLSSHPELLNLPDDQGRTPLHLAVEWQHVLVVSALADLGADRTTKDHLGNTSLDIARMSGEYRMGAYTYVSRKIVTFLEAALHTNERLPPSERA